MPRTARLALAALTIAALAVGASAAQAVSGPVTYSGTVASASGTVAAQKGHAVRVVLTGFHAPTPSGSLPLGSFTAVITCPVRVGCASGTVKGTWTTRPTLPDTGNAVVLKATATLHHLGAVIVRGDVHGPGNIASSRPTLTLHIHGHHGTERIVAQAPPVPGFTPIF